MRYINTPKITSVVAIKKVHQKEFLCHLNYKVAPTLPDSWKLKLFFLLKNKKNAHFGHEIEEGSAKTKKN